MQQPNLHTSDAFKGKGDGYFGTYNPFTKALEKARPLGNSVEITQETKTETKKRPGMGRETFGQTITSYMTANEGTEIKVKIDSTGVLQNLKIALLANLNHVVIDASTVALGLHLHHNTTTFAPNFKVNKGTIIIKELPQLVVGSGSASLLFIQSQPHATPLSVTITDPGEDDQILKISVVGRDISISLATTALGAIKSTVSDILTAALPYAKDFEVFTVEGTTLTAKISELSKTSMAPPPVTYVENVDYRIGSEGEQIYALETGAIISGRPYHVEYNVASHSEFRMSGATELVHGGGFLFDMENHIDGGRLKVIIPYAKIQPTGSMAWLNNDDFASIELSIFPELQPSEESSLYVITEGNAV